MFDLALIIPCFNEAPRIPSTFAALVSFFSGAAWENKRIALIFVNDGSTDETAAALLVLPKPETAITIFTASYPTNQGKGAAIIHGARQVDADAYGFIDADLAFPLETFQDMYARLAGADLVVGQRTTIRMPTMSARIRWIISRALQQLVAFWLQLSVRDTQCGMKVFSKKIVTDIFPTVQNHRFAFDVELLRRATRIGFTIDAIPVTFQYHGGSSVRVRDGLQYLRDVWRLRSPID